jgi:hypothetical protein
MKSIFALFKDYQDAEAAAADLLEKGFEEDEMNVIVHEQNAKNHMDVNLEKVKVDATNKVGEQNVHGLVRILAGQRPVRLSDVGPIYAAGEIATMLARAAANPGAVNGGLQAALVDFSVPKEVAEEFTTGIENEGVLFWIRTSDERAPEASSVLHSHKGVHVGNYAR